MRGRFSEVNQLETDKKSTYLPHIILLSLIRIRLVSSVRKYLLLIYPLCVATQLYSHSHHLDLQHVTSVLALPISISPHIKAV